MWPPRPASLQLPAPPPVPDHPDIPERTLTLDEIVSEVQGPSDLLSVLARPAGGQGKKEPKLQSLGITPERVAKVSSGSRKEAVRSRKLPSSR